MILRKRNPDLFHGHGRKSNFFEGWYFKIVDPTEKHTFAFIPGIILGATEGASHSFLQLIHGTKAYYRYLSHPVHAFEAKKNAFDVSVGDNRFSLERLHLQVEDTGIRARGQIDFRNVATWPDTVLNPGSMGFYNYIPRMQCYSQVCALDMDLQGSLEINGDKIDFSGGRGYVEKNWGSAFPYSWIWVQSNNFAKSRTSLTCSLAHIPFLMTSFRGFLIGMTVEGKFFSFTTMNGSRCHIQQAGRDVRIQVRNSTHTLAMETWTDPKKFILLQGPRDGRMVPLVQENLLGRVKVELQDRHGKRVFADEGACAGIEYGGRQMLVLDGEPDPS